MKIKSALVSAVLLALTCLYAQATVLTLSTKGTLSGTDYSGWFAAPGTYLDSVNYSLRFNIERDSQFAGTWEGRSGAYLVGEAPILVSLTFNNAEAPISGYYWGHKIYAEIGDGTPSGMFDNFSLSARARTIYGDPIFEIRQEVVSLDSNFAFAYATLGEGRFKVLPGESIGSQFRFYDSTRGRYNEFLTTISSVTLSQRDGVIPEPGSLALISVGLLAAAAFRRKATAK